jgi:hypothetical protein
LEFCKGIVSYTREQSLARVVCKRNLVPWEEQEELEHELQIEPCANTVCTVRATIPATNPILEYFGFRQTYEDMCS